MFRFKQYLLENTEDELMKRIRAGDHVSFQVWLDYMMDSGREIPPQLEMWRNLYPGNYTRWMIKRDMSEIVWIEKLSTDQPLSEEELTDILIGKNIIGIVSENRKGLILGYCIYALYPDHFRIIRLGVHPLARNKGVGKGLIDKIKEKMNDRRTRIVMTHPSEMKGFLNSQKFNSNDMGNFSIYNAQ